MKYLSLFSGYGGFELGIQQAYEERCVGCEKWGNELCSSDKGKSKVSSSGNTEGRCSKQPDNGAEGLTCIGFSEIDKYAIQVYKKHFNHKEYGDITKLDPTTLPDFDLLCGGFPCQAFSIAGKRAGFEDTRGTLIYDVFRIIKEKHTKLVLLENVKGLLSHDNGRTFKTIITSLAELGYAVEWQVLNAKNYGVPQNRERVFIIGHLGGFGGRQVFPITEGSQGNLKYSGAVISARQKWLQDGKNNSRNFSQGQRIYNTDGISQCLAGNAGGQGGKTGLYETEELKIRRLTPTECERLMGLPDGWTEGVSDTQRYKLCGNGVVVNVVKEIIKRLTL